jgi:hypothetical protein
LASLSASPVLSRTSFTASASTVPPAALSESTTFEVLPWVKVKLPRLTHCPACWVWLTVLLVVPAL